MDEKLINGANRYLETNDYVVEDITTKNGKKFKLTIGNFGKPDVFYCSNRREMQDHINAAMNDRGAVSVNVEIQDENGEWKWIHQAHYDEHLGTKDD